MRSQSQTGREVCLAYIARRSKFQVLVGLVEHSLLRCDRASSSNVQAFPPFKRSRVVMRGHFMNDILKHNLFASIVRRSLHVYPNVHCERTTRTGSQCEVRNLPRFEFNTNGCQTFEDRITRPICDKHKTCNRYNPSYVFHLQLANTV